MFQYEVDGSRQLLSDLAYTLAYLDLDTYNQFVSDARGQRIARQVAQERVLFP